MKIFAVVNRQYVDIHHTKISLAQIVTMKTLYTGTLFNSKFFTTSVVFAQMYQLRKEIQFKVKLFGDKHFRCKEDYLYSVFGNIFSFQYPTLKAACVTLEMSWTIGILHLHSPEADLFMKVIMMCANIKLFYLFTSFHYILNAPGTQVQ